jgi:hypothetical protein
VEGAFCTRCGNKLDSSGEPDSQAPQSGMDNPPPTDSPESSPSDLSTPSSHNAASPSSGAPVKKKRGPLVWILGGCLLLIVVVAVIVVSTGLFVFRKAGIDPELARENPGLAAAKMIATMNPDIEVLSVDEDSGTIALMDKKTGKTVTVDMDDIEKGKITFTGEGNDQLEIQTRGEGSVAEMEIRSQEGSVIMGASSAANLPSWLPVYPGTEDRGTFSISSQDGLSGSCSFKTDDSVERVASFYEDSLEQAGFSVRKTETRTPEGSIIILSATDDFQRSANVTTVKTNEGTAINLAFEDKE